MLKSYWLLSAGAVALATPAFAQDASRPTPVGSPVEEGQVQDDRPMQAPEVQPTGVHADIIVTAQGRRQILQDVPLAVSAVTADTMQNSGANDIRQLNQLAPSLLVSSTGTEANAAPRIRGIGTVGDNPGLEHSVAVFVDGVYRSRAGAAMNDLGEIERIEVMRGPQGTLFGRNASAGLLHIISKRPTFTFEGFGEATYGNYNNVRVVGGVSGPLMDALAFRLDGVYHRRDGFYRVVNAAGGTESRVNDRNRMFVKGQLLFEPTDTLSIRLIGDYSNRNESCCGAVYIDTTAKAAVPGQPGSFSVVSNPMVDVLQSLGWVNPSAGDPYARDIAINPGRTYRGQTDDWGISGHVDLDLGGATLTSITAYRDYQSEAPSDTDYSNVDILYRADDGNAFRQFKTFTQEVRLQGSVFNGVFDWLIGGYFANEDLHTRDNLKFGSQYGAFATCRLLTALPSPTGNNRDLRNPNAPGCMTPLGRAVVTGAFGAASPLVLQGLERLYQVNNVGDNPANYYQDSRNWALFTHNIFNITNNLSLTVGLRHTNERKRFAADFNNTNVLCPAQKQALSPLLPTGAGAFVGGIISLTCQGNSSAELNALTLADQRNESEWTGTGVLSYKPRPELLLYGSYSRGYKAGGFNLDRSALGSPLTPRSNADVSRLQFDPEIVDAFEVGLKFTRRTVVFNVIAFHQEFKNFQLNTFDGSVFLVQNINSCAINLGGADRSALEDTARCPVDQVRAGVVSSGVELEAAVYPARDLQVTGGATFARTRYRENLIGGADGTPLSRALFMLPGQQMSNAPPMVVTASLTYTPEFGATGLRGLFYIDTRLSSDYNTGSDLFPEKEQDAFAVVNARIGLRGPQHRWALELWAQNLFDTNYKQVAFNSPFQGSNSVAHTLRHSMPATQMFSAFLAEPRTYGITGRFRF